MVEISWLILLVVPCGLLCLVLLYGFIIVERVPKFSFTNKYNQKYGRVHILISGGSSGIGLAVAKLIATKCVEVNISIIARDQSRLTAAEQQLKSINRQAKI